MENEIIYVTLKITETGKVNEFRIDHAEALLKLNDGWELADEKYEFINNKLELK